MRTTRTLILIGGLVLLGAGPAQSQRGGMQPLFGDKPRQLTRSDVQELNPARVLLDKRKDLGIDEPTRVRLDSLARQLDAQIVIHIKVTDSLDKVMSVVSKMRPPRLTDSAKLAQLDTVVERAQAAHREFITRLLAIKEDFDSTSARSAAALTAAQREKGSPLVVRAMRELTDLLRRENVTSRVGPPRRPGGGA